MQNCIMAHHRRILDTLAEISYPSHIKDPARDQLIMLAACKQEMDT